MIRTLLKSLSEFPKDCTQFLKKWFFCYCEFNRIRELEDSLDSMERNWKAEKKEYESRANYWYNESKTLKRRNECLAKIVEDMGRKKQR